MQFQLRNISYFTRGFQPFPLPRHSSRSYRKLSAKKRGALIVKQVIIPEQEHEITSPESLFGPGSLAYRQACSSATHHRCI